MVLKVLIGVFVLLLGFLGYVASRPGHFHYERSGSIQAGPAEIFPYLNDFKKGALWSPYEKMDPNMKKTYSGPETGPGARMDFEGNSDTGSGSLEILREVPDSRVELKLIMTKPMSGENGIVYTLEPAADGSTVFKWSMEGDGGFMSKLIGVLIDCEKMVGDQFSTGIANLKEVVEANKKK